MEHHEHGKSGLGQHAHEVEDLEAVVQVEVAGRLVEQQDGGLLRERLGERNPLEIAAGELLGEGVGESVGVGHLHDLAHEAVILTNPVARTEEGGRAGPSSRPRSR